MTFPATAQKFSATLPSGSYSFLENWRNQCGMKRSQALDIAVQLLQEQELTKEYAMAYNEEKTAIEDWDDTLLDGLDANETW